MVYSTEAAKWKAYEFSDPFAAGSFCVCNKVNRLFCRPDCDARPTTTLKLEIRFVEDAATAMSLGYVACESCDPVQTPQVDVRMLVQCVADINKLIGLMSPLMDENEDLNNQKIKATIMESKKGSDSRRMSAPVINLDGKFTKDTPLSKNDSDHYRLVDLACRHLALAAASNLCNKKGSDDSPSSPGEKKKRRRGGVLGFKELAAKSKLSAWHFHRVFKSVTGLTPKTYGDKCWEYIKKHSGDEPVLRKRKFDAYQTPLSSTSASLVEDYSVPTSPEFDNGKRAKLETPDLLSPIQMQKSSQMAQPIQYQSFQLDPLADLSAFEPSYHAQSIPQSFFPQDDLQGYVLPMVSSFTPEKQLEDLSTTGFQEMPELQEFDYMQLVDLGDFVGYENGISNEMLSANIGL